MLSNKGLELLSSPPANEYAAAQPFPHAVFDGVIEDQFLSEVLDEFPDLRSREDIINFNRPTSVKLAGKGEQDFGPRTRQLMHFLNSEPFLVFLQKLTGIQEVLISDPYYEGGGLHEIKRGGFLKIHADFNRHAKLGLDRRINVLLYLNKNWDHSYGGQFELWPQDMKSAKAKIDPLFNRMVVFSTNDYSLHGHPDPLMCPEERSRKSLALYYYSNGRPASEISGDHSTLYRARPGQDRSAARFEFVRDLVPPIIVKMLSRPH